MKVLLEYEANVNREANNQLTPLHLTAKNGHTKVAKVVRDMTIEVVGANVRSQILLDNGAEVNATERDGWTPLHYAARHGHPEVSKVCIFIVYPNLLQLMRSTDSS